MRDSSDDFKYVHVLLFQMTLSEPLVNMDKNSIKGSNMKCDLQEYQCTDHTILSSLQMLCDWFCLLTFLLTLTLINSRMFFSPKTADIFLIFIPTS